MNQKFQPCLAPQPICAGFLESLSPCIRLWYGCHSQKFTYVVFRISRQLRHCAQFSPSEPSPRFNPSSLASQLLKPRHRLRQIHTPFVPPWPSSPWQMLRGCRIDFLDLEIASSDPFDHKGHRFGSGVDRDLYIYIYTYYIIYIYLSIHPSIHTIYPSICTYPIYIYLFIYIYIYMFDSSCWLWNAILCHTLWHYDCFETWMALPITATWIIIDLCNIM